jgi:Histidyl-tRNA synthetase
MKIEKLKGTRDFDARAMKVRREIERGMRGVFERFGFEEIQTPTIEPLDLFLLKSGETVINETYNFKDKGNREICLVPERTAPTIRFYVSQLQRRERPLKLYYFENCFRYENPQRARYREFWHIGAEVIGMNDRARTNAELIALAQTSLEEIGLKTEVRIGNLDILKRALSRVANKEDTKDGMQTLMRAIDKNNIDFLEERISDKNFFLCWGAKRLMT